jgi:hypothetical protein
VIQSTIYLQSTLAMLIGRTAGSGLLRLIAAEQLFPLALVVTLLGFLAGGRPESGKGWYALIER